MSCTSTSGGSTSSRVPRRASEKFSCRCGCELTRENAQAKGERYLLSGRLTIRLVTPERIEAHVKGDSGHIYRVIHDNGLWTCSCLLSSAGPPGGAEARGVEAWRGGAGVNRRYEPGRHQIAGCWAGQVSGAGLVDRWASYARTARTCRPISRACLEASPRTGAFGRSSQREGVVVGVFPNHLYGVGRKRLQLL